MPTKRQARGAVVWVFLLLAGCQSLAPVAGQQPPVSATDTESESAPAAHSAQPQQSHELLPSITRTGVAVSNATLRERPRLGSVVIRSLPLDAAVQIVGDLSNADGQWLSVVFDGVLGWVRAEEIREETSNS